MDIITIVQVVFRRWYVSMPLVITALAAAGYLQWTTPPAYEAEGQLLLADPSLDPSGLPASVVDLDEILRQLEEPSLRDDLQDGDAVYQLDPEDESTIAVTVNASSEGSAESTVRAIGDWIRRTVSEIQETAGFPAEEGLQVRGGDRSLIITSDPQTGTVQASSVITLFDPTASTFNPYVASIATVRLLVVAVESDTGRSAVMERTGPGVGFVLSQTARDAAPIMTVTTSGSDPAVVLGAFDAVRLAVDDELQARQDKAEIPLTRRTRVEALAEPRTVTDVSPPVNRAAGALFGLGALLAVAGAVVTESILSRRHDAARAHAWREIEGAGIASFDVPGPPTSAAAAGETEKG